MTNPGSHPDKRIDQAARLLLDRLPKGLMLWTQEDGVFRLLFVNDIEAARLEAPATDLIGRTAEDLEQRLGMPYTAFCREIFNSQTRMIWKLNGEDRHTLVVQGFLLDEQMAGLELCDTGQCPAADFSYDQLGISVEKSPVSIVITERDGRIEYANPAFEKITGYSRQEVIGKNPRFLKSGEQSHTFYKHLWDTILAGKVWSGEFHNRRKDRQTYWAKTSINPIIHHNGQIQSFLAIAEDITEQKRLQEELQTANQKLKESLESLKEREQQLLKQERLHALGRMASGVSHDFNNALQPILLAASALVEDENLLADRDLVQSYLRDILRAAEGAAGTVRRLARFYKPSVRSEMKTIDLRKLAHDVIDFTHMKWKEGAQTQGRHIDVTASIEDNCYIEGLEDEIRELLINLIFNAVEAIEGSGNIVVRVSHQQGELIRLDVADTGCGMPKEIAEKCLEPFYTTKHERGTGLGLSIVYGIVERHRGKIEIESRENIGTTIRILLPAVKPAALDIKREQKAAIPAGPRKIRDILVVDDEALVLHVLTRILEHYGHQVITALSGMEALAQLENHDVDLVITDQAMPGMTGEQMAEIVKSRQPGLPIVMLTGFGDLMGHEARRPNHIDELLSKPIDAERLEAAIQKLSRSKDDIEA